MSQINNPSPFIVFCQKTIPLAFDESMSYMEAIYAFKAYLENEVVPAVNTNAQAVEDLTALVNQMQEYIDHYFDNLDVQEEIDNKLDEMAEDGTLTELIRNYIDPIMGAFQEHIDSEVEEQNNAIRNQNIAIDDIATRVNSVVGNDPIPVASTDDMTDTTKIYVLTTNGYWYYYDGEYWVQGGLFQSAQNSNLLNENVYLRDQYLNNEFGKNLLNQESPYIITGKYIGSSAYADGTNYRCSHPILVKAGISYTFTTIYQMGNNKARYAYVNPDLSLITVYNATDNGDDTATFTAPDDGYIIFNLYRNQSKVVFSKTSDYQSTLNYTLINKHLGTNLNLAINELSLDNLAYYSRSVNLFDKNSPQIISGKYISASGYVDLSSQNISHPIYLQEGDILKYTFPVVSVGNNHRYAKCDVNGTYIQSYNGEVDEDGIFTATIPETGYYVFDIGKVADYTNNYMFVKNIAMPDEYVAYKSALNNVQIPYLDAKIDNLPSNISPLNTKKLGVTGDSICAGAGYNGGYAKIIGEKYSMTVQNIGVGGGTITSGTTYAITGNNRFWINESIDNLDNDCDYVLVEGGVNDSSLGVELGTISNGYNASLDTTTYYGAFENMLKQLITRFAGKKYAYVAVHQMTANYRVINPEETSYYWASKKCCEKWGVPFIDLNVEVPPFGFFTNSMGDLYTLRQTYTHNGDGWHPNEDGYEKYYVDKIAKFMESL